jgi:glycosyltransferase involved in cell wall biosynthesis
MPVYNCEQTLAQAIRSILCQTYENWELILIDDGSTDKTLDVARSFTDPRIRIFVDEKNRGLPTQLNKTVSLSQGIYFARMDGDDISYPERFERQVAYLESHPDVDLVGASFVRFKSDGVVFGKSIRPETHSEICSRAFVDGIRILHPSFMGHLKWFQQHPYNEGKEAVRSEDQELLHRTYHTSTFANVPEVLLGYRDENRDYKRRSIGRRNSIRRKLRYHVRQKRYDLAIQAFMKHSWKGIAEILSLRLGFQEILLKHSTVLPLSENEQQKWKKAWELANQPFQPLKG